MPGREDQRSVEFGADGSTLAEGQEDNGVIEEAETFEEPAEEAEEPAEETEEAAEEPEEPAEEPNPATQKAKPKGKYRIGDKFFATEAEALAYANAQETSQPDRLDAYRQGLLDAANLVKPGESVTPPPEDDEIPFNEEEYYTDPAGYMRKRDKMLIEKAAQKISSQTSLRDQGNAIWNEFVSRHPEFAEYRAETEAFVSENKDELQGMTTTKGRPATFDYIALRLKGKFRKYANLATPSRELPNAGGGPSPAGNRTGVTPPKPKEKPLSMAQQIRLNRKVR